ncbi:hypothetical protein EXU85_03950 [Spirosoma sp. KCTC 42546]|uniref:hypothetical protein n=1 Tax=Spirosoma sp. KCTC 42546 TaxID=2520506 RepID=UPI00115B1072|nr:hypothetical protein [Spirosoma sp. KCTC 42546]QDK77791.1 hypothetical protein EXU85_03950 [Spirosoma sp. KCTC 42546]
MALMPVSAIDVQGICQNHGLQRGYGYDGKPPPGRNSRRKFSGFSSDRRPSRNARAYGDA